VEVAKALAGRWFNCSGNTKEWGHTNKSKSTNERRVHRA